MRKTVDSVQFGDTLITYMIERRPRRSTLGITVEGNGQVRVVAPKGMRAARIAVAVKARAAWVLKQQDEFRRLRKGYPRVFVSGESFPYLGRCYQLKVRRVPSGRGRTTVVCSGGSFHVAIRGCCDDKESREAVKQVLEAWYREHARAKLEKIAARLAKRLGMAFDSVRILDMRKRWGSCGKTGVLRFNWRIIMAKSRLVEYVVAHELCHLLHRDHSSVFWRTLGTVIPDYAQRRKELMLEGPRLDF